MGLLKVRCLGPRSVHLNLLNALVQVAADHREAHAYKEVEGSGVKVLEGAV